MFDSHSLHNAIGPAIIGLLVVGRFLARELRERRIPFNRFFAVPILFGVVTVGFIVYAGYTYPYYIPELAIGLVAAVAVGAVIGLAVDRFTSVGLDKDGTSALLRGSWTTVAIWIAALLLRLVGRYVALGTGVHAVGITLTLNAVLVALLFVAMVVLRMRLLARAVALRAGSSLAL
jgi:hypothetical protein